MRKRKAYNPLKHAAIHAKHTLKNLAIGRVPGQGPCKILNLRTYQVADPTKTQFQQMTTIRHKWTIYMAVFGIGVDGKPYSKADEMEASEPYFQWELEDLLVEKHKQIVASFNKNQMLSVGWIATPYPKSWDEREAARHLINLGALDFEQIEPGVVRSLIA